MPDLYAAQPESNLAALLARMQRPRRVDDPTSQQPTMLPVPRAPNPSTETQPAQGNFPGGSGTVPTNPNAPWGGGDAGPVADIKPGHGLAATIAAMTAREQSRGAIATPTPEAVVPPTSKPLDTTQPIPAHPGYYPSGPGASGALAAKLDAVRASTPGSTVAQDSERGWVVTDPAHHSKLREGLVGALQGAVLSGANGPTAGTGLRMLGGAGAGAITGAVSPRLIKALEQHQEEQRIGAQLEQAQQTELRTAQVRDTQAQATQREADAVKVDYTPPGALYPVKVDPKDYAKLTQRDSENAQDPWTTYTPPGSRTPLRVRSSVAARLESTNGDNLRRLAEQDDKDKLITRRLDEQERHNRESEKLGRTKEAKTAQNNINKLKQAQSKVEAYGKQRDALDKDADRLERAAAAEDTKTDKWGDQDAVSKARAVDLRRQADEKRRASQRAHDQIIQAQSVVDAIPETADSPAPAASSRARSIGAWSRDNPNATTAQRAAKQAEWESKGIKVVQ